VKRITVQEHLDATVNRALFDGSQLARLIRYREDLAAVEAIQRYRIRERNAEAMRRVAASLPRTSPQRQ
jgi:hypothetical protein